MVGLSLTAHEALNPIVFSLGLKADQVHAAFSAVVSSSEPVPFCFPEDFFVALSKIVGR